MTDPAPDLTSGRWVFRLDTGELELVSHEPGTRPVEATDTNTRGEERGMRDRFWRLFRKDPEE